MSQLLHLHAAAESSAPSLAGRNNALLEFRDAALHLAYRMSGNIDDAEDILQSAFLRAVSAPEPVLAGSHLRNWFLQITANAARDYFRSEQSRRARERKVAMHRSLDSSPPACSNLEQRELRSQVEKELAALDEKYRLPIALHYEQGLSYDDAAGVLGVPAGTLRVYASHGMKELREKLNAPSRPVTAEILIAALGVGIALTASPALAASVQEIVTHGPALLQAPTAAAGAKPLLVAAKSATGTGVWMAVTAAALVCMTVFAGLGFVVYERMQNAPTALAQRNPPAIVKLPEAPPPEEPKPAPNPPVIVPIDVAPFVANVVDVVDVRPGDFIMPAETEAQWEKADDLIKLADPRGAVVGSWGLQNGTITVTPGDFARMALPYEPPEEYDFRVDFTRRGGADVNMIFPAGPARESSIFKMGSWNSCYFGTWKDNPDAVPLPGFQNSVRHTAIIEVRRTTLTAYIDGKLMKSIELGKSSSACTPDYRLPDQRMIGLGAWRNNIDFHRVLIRAVAGQGKSLQHDADANNAVSDAYWTTAKNLIPAAVNPKHALVGSWQSVNGTLTTDAVRHSRYQFNYAPPEEYDFRVIFTRLDGNSDVAQIISAGGRQFVWKMDISGVSLFDTVGGGGRDANPTVLHTPGLVVNGQTHSAVVCVRKTGVKVFVDGKLLSARATDFADFGIEPAWKLASPEVIGVGFHNCRGVFHAIQIKEVTGQGKTIELPETVDERERAF